MSESPRWTSESRPRLRRGVLIAPADGGRWQVRWDFDEVIFLSGQSCSLVLPWLTASLDGQTSLKALEGHAIEKGCGNAFREVIDCLCEQRLLEDEARVTDSDHVGIELTSAIEALGGNGEAITQKLAGTSAVVIGRSPLASRLTASLAAQGFHRVRLLDPETTLPEGALAVAVESDCSPDQLERINARALSLRHPWMLTGAWNRRVLVGPIFIPGETACYDCYRKRLASHRAHLEAYQALEEWRLAHPAPPDPEPVLPAIVELAAAHTALELFHYITELRPARTVGRVLVSHPADAEMALETVLRIPWCEACAAVPTIGPSMKPDLSRSSPLI